MLFTFKKKFNPLSCRFEKNTIDYGVRLRVSPLTEFNVILLTSITSNRIKIKWI